MDKISANFLVTKEDFYAYKKACCRAQLRRWEVTLCRVTGMALATAAGFGIWLLPGTAAKAACGMLLAGSLAMGLFYDTMYPYLVHRRILAMWENVRPQAFQLSFSEDAFEVVSERYHAGLPYKLLNRVYEDDRLFWFDLGAGQSHFLPKRALSEVECQLLSRLLSRVMKNHYTKEGVH